MRNSILIIMLLLLPQGHKVMAEDTTAEKKKVVEKVASLKKDKNNQKELKKADIRQDRETGYNYANSRRLQFYATIRDKEISPSKVKMIELYVSADRGQTWKYHSQVANVNTIMKFTAERDGFYMFATVATDQLGRKGKMPKTAEDAMLSVHVDTSKPRLDIRRDEIEFKCNPKDMRKIRWKFVDLHPHYVTMEYFNYHSKSWNSAGNIKSDQEFYVLEVPNIAFSAYKVRFRAVDRAGNEGVSEELVFDLGPMLNVVASSISTAHKFSRQRELEFGLSQEGMNDSDFKQFEVWYTMDNGQSWAVAGVTSKNSLIWQAPRDGRYGFYSVAINRDGNGEPRPSQDTKPKMTCLVDTKKPQLVLDSPRGGERYTSERPLVIRWHGIEKNPGKFPVRIFFSRDNGLTFDEKEVGRVYPINGSYRMSLEGLAGHQYYVRLVAEDEAGHQMTAISEKFAIGTLTAEEQAQMDTHFEKANAFRVFGRWKEAITEYEEVLKYNVQEDKALHDMGAVYMKLKDYDKAIQVLQKASRIKPKNTLYLFNLGYALYLNKMPLLAQSTFEKLLNIDDRHVRAHWHISEIYFINKEIAKSRAHLERILEIDDATNQHKPLAKKRLEKYPEK